MGTGGAAPRLHPSGNLSVRATERKGWRSTLPADGGSAPSGIRRFHAAGNYTRRPDSGCAHPRHCISLQPSKIDNSCSVPRRACDHLSRTCPHRSRADLCRSASPAPHRARVSCLCGPCMEGYAGHTRLRELRLGDLAPAAGADGAESRVAPRRPPRHTRQPRTGWLSSGP